MAKKSSVCCRICAWFFTLQVISRVSITARSFRRSSVPRAWRKTRFPLAVTGLFVTYGVGQLISGFLGDRIAPKYLITGGLVLASAMNFLLPLNANPYYMLVIWCINGLGQAFMWPPIVKLLSGYLNDKEYSRATVIVSWGSSGGTIAIYLIAPLMISLAGWRSVFYLCAALGLAAAVLCFGSVSAVERKAGKAVRFRQTRQQRSRFCGKEKRNAAVYSDSCVYFHRHCLTGHAA